MNIHTRSTGKAILVLALSIAICLVWLGLTPNSPASQAQFEQIDLEATVRVEAGVPSGEPVILVFTLTNRSANDLLALQWFTPLEGIAGDIFRVELNGEPVPYRGILVKRGLPTAEEYKLIKAGESISAEVNLASAYDLSKPGNYAVQFLNPPISDVADNEGKIAKSLDDLGPIEIQSEPARLEILGPEVPLEPAPGELKDAKAPVYSNCNDTQKSTLSVADASATINTSFSYTYLNGLAEAERKTNSEYKTWFGAYDAARYATVLGKWNSINSTFANQSVTYNCDQSSCQNSWYAYVYSGGALEVFLCPQFWNAPDTGVDTKFGTIIHEVSHEVASTKDHAYGVTNCKNLATNDPGKAVENADCYEYFAEHHKVNIGPETLILPMLLVIGAASAEGIRRFRRLRSHAE